MSQQLELNTQKHLIASTSETRKKETEVNKDNKQVLADAQLVAIVDALVKIQAHAQVAVDTKKGGSSSEATSSHAPGGVRESGVNWHDKATWKGLLQELLSLLSSGSPEALAKFLKDAQAMLDHLGDCPADLKGKITALLKEVFSKFLGQKDAMNYMAELYAIYYQELKQKGDPNAAQDAQKMMKDLFSNIQNELGIDVSAYYKDGNFTSGFTHSMQSYQDKSLSELFGDLQPAATAFFNTGSGGIFNDIEGYLNSAYQEIVKNEPFWEKVMDVMNIWSYLYSNASMAKFNNTANLVNEIKQIISEMHNDMNEMGSSGDDWDDNPKAEAIAKDFAAKFAQLKALEDNPALGDPSSSGSAANSLKNFLDTIYNQQSEPGQSGSETFGKLIDEINAGSATAADSLASYFSYYFSNRSNSKTPSPVIQSINTDFTNAEGTFSTLAQTTGMQVQNQSTNMDTLIKLSNSARNIMNQLIRPMTTYTGS